jgi:hypothetical protein
MLFFTVSDIRKAIKALDSLEAKQIVSLCSNGTVNSGQLFINDALRPAMKLLGDLLRMNRVFNEKEE